MKKALVLALAVLSYTDQSEANLIGPMVGVDFWGTVVIRGIKMRIEGKLEQKHNATTVYHISEHEDPHFRKAAYLWFGDTVHDIGVHEYNGETEVCPISIDGSLNLDNCHSYMKVYSNYINIKEPGLPIE